MTGIYIHVPFCKRKCPYCSFYSVEYDEGLCESYVIALKRNIEKYKGEAVFIDTVYFGGGTPSLLTPYQVRDILKSVNESFILAPEMEITMEANPSSVDFDKLCDLITESPDSAVLVIRFDNIIFLLNILYILIIIVFRIYSYPIIIHF